MTIAVATYILRFSNAFCKPLNSAVLFTFGRHGHVLILQSSLLAEDVGTSARVATHDHILRWVERSPTLNGSHVVRFLCMGSLRTIGMGNDASQHEEDDKEEERKRRESIHLKGMQVHMPARTEPYAAATNP